MTVVPSDGATVAAATFHHATRGFGGVSDE
jgi:hypothetical protein